MKKEEEGLFLVVVVFGFDFGLSLGGFFLLPLCLSSDLIEVASKGFEPRGRVFISSLDLGHESIEVVTCDDVMGANDVLGD